MWKVPVLIKAEIFIIGVTATAQTGHARSTEAGIVPQFFTPFDSSAKIGKTFIGGRFGAARIFFLHRTGIASIFMFHRAGIASILMFHRAGVACIFMFHCAGIANILVFHTARIVLHIAGIPSLRYTAGTDPNQ